MGKNREGTGKVTYDFKGLSEALLGQAESLLYSWVPGGKKRGHEYVAGSIAGGPGESFACNLTSGKWADFATDEKGGDLIALYAAINQIDNGQAYKELSEQMNFSQQLPPPVKNTVRPETSVVRLPPKGIAPPQMKHPLYGEPKAVYDYRNEDGDILHFIARYEPKPGEKQFLPYSYAEGKWRTKAYPAPRPLFGLPLLKEYPKKHVLLVEGEKACLAARKLVNGHYVALTWSGGAMAYTKADFEPLRGRSVLIWPDCDVPGMKAAHGLSRKLLGLGCQVKVIDVSGLPMDGFDAADFQGSWDDLISWAKPKAKLVSPEVLPPEEPPQEEAPFPEDAPPALTEEQKDIIGELGLFKNAKGVPYDSEINIVKILSGMGQFSGRIWFDEFHGKIFTDLGGVRKEWSDSDSLSFLLFLQQNFPMPHVSVDKVDRAVDSYAATRKRNEPKDWMESLKWDNTPRVDAFFSRYFGAREDLYTCTVSGNFLISIVARIYQPGCKVDNMPVLISNQGTRKSTAIEALGSPWYASITESPASKDFYVALQGKMLIELEELKTMKNQDAELVKAMLSKATDRLRMPYAKRAMDYPRQGVFIGTTNKAEFLTDETGNRRFWPIQTKGEIKVAEIKRDRDQIFAEAVAKYKAGTTWWSVPPVAEEIQEGHRRHDEWEESIEEWCSGRSDITVRSVATDLLKIQLAELDMFRQKRIARILTKIGYEKRIVWAGNKTTKIWYKKDA